MYYAIDLFIKKGALGKIWLAGTVFKKLNKKSIVNSNIHELCEEVKNPPDIPEGLAISTVGTLTLGIVKIHDKHVTYLYEDASTALKKLRSLLVSKKINLPQQIIQPKDRITLPEYKDDLNLLEMNQDIIPIKRIDTNINIDEQQMELDIDQFMMPLRRKDIDIDINIEPQIIPDDVSLQLPDMTQELTEIQADHEFDIPEPTAISIVSDEKKIEPPIDIGLIQPPRTPSIPSIIGPDLPPIQPDTEPRVSRDVRPSATPPERKRDKGKRKPKFGSDNGIEYENDEHLIGDNEWDRYTVDRPNLESLNDRPVNDRQFRDIFHTNLAGNIDSDTQLTEIYRKYMGYIYNPNTSPLIDADADADIIVPDIDVDIERPRGADDEFKQDIPELSVGDSRSPDTLFGKDVTDYDTEFKEQRPKSLKVSSPDESSTPKESDKERRPRVDRSRKRRTKYDDTIFDVSAEDLKSSETIDVELPRKRKPTSTDEQTLTDQMTKLTDIVFTMIRNEMNSDQINELNGINMVNFFKKQIRINQPYGTPKKRDIARGFMQILILKNVDLIDLQQRNNDILIYKGTNFNGYQPNT